jgi:glutamate racemase
MLKSTKHPTHEEQSRLAVLDWGIGGFGFYNLFKGQHPGSPVLYFSDAGYTPYGKVEKSVLQKRLREIAKFLQEQHGITHLVIACHAATSIIFDELGHGHFENVTGIAPHAVQQIKDSRGQDIGIIGGVGTIQSNFYKSQLSSINKTIHQQIAQPLSAIIEKGIPDQEELNIELLKILKPLQGHIDHLLLACTHYPVIFNQIQSCLPGVVLLDPAPVMLTWIEKNWPVFNSPSVDHFVTTGKDPYALHSALQGFGGEAIYRLLKSPNYTNVSNTLV